MNLTSVDPTRGAPQHFIGGIGENYIGPLRDAIEPCHAKNSAPTPLAEVSFEFAQRLRQYGPKGIEHSEAHACSLKVPSSDVTERAASMLRAAPCAFSNTPSSGPMLSIESVCAQPQRARSLW